jgi:hypothetical protein
MTCFNQAITNRKQSPNCWHTKILSSCSYAMYGPNPERVNCWSSCILVIAYSSKAMGEADIGASFLDTASVLIDLTEDNGFFCPSRFHSPLYSHIDGRCQVYWVTVFYTRVFALSAHQTLHLHWPAMKMYAVNVRSHASFYKKLIFTCNKRHS